MKKQPSPPPYFNQRKELEGVRLVAKRRYKNSAETPCMRARESLPSKRTRLVIAPTKTERKEQNTVPPSDKKGRLPHDQKEIYPNIPLP